MRRSGLCIVQRFRPLLAPILTGWIEQSIVQAFDWGLVSSSSFGRGGLGSPCNEVIGHANSHERQSEGQLAHAAEPWKIEMLAAVLDQRDDEERGRTNAYENGAGKSSRNLVRTRQVRLAHP